MVNKIDKLKRCMNQQMKIKKKNCSCDFYGLLSKNFIEIPAGNMC